MYLIAQGLIRPLVVHCIRPYAGGPLPTGDSPKRAELSEHPRPGSLTAYASRSRQVAPRRQKRRCPSTLHATHRRLFIFLPLSLSCKPRAVLIAIKKHLPRPHAKSGARPYPHLYLCALPPVTRTVPGIALRRGCAWCYCRCCCLLLHCCNCCCCSRVPRCG